MTDRSASQNAIAVMDLGTNTFHLLIADGNTGLQNELFHTSLPIWLGEGGMKDGFIQPAAYRRGIEALQHFKQRLDDFKVTEVIAIGTSALRTSGNGANFIEEVNAKTGIEIKTIDGGQEASFIYQGIRASECLTGENSLILDIGGGSVEFILGNNQDIIWKQSFEIGAARLMEKFHQTDPMPGHCVEELNRYLEEKLKPLDEIVSRYPVQQLVGASGAFESFAEMIEQMKRDDFDLKKQRNYTFNYQELVDITDWIIESSHFERETNKAIIPVRVDMIVTAALVTRFVMKKLGIKEVCMSTYSLKEGVLAGMLAV